MTHTVIEKMARAMLTVDMADAPWLDDWEGLDDFLRTAYLNRARSAMMALRDADDVQMRMAGRNAVMSAPVSPMADYSVSIGYGFKAMIDHVLQESEK